MAQEVKEYWQLENAHRNMGEQVNFRNDTDYPLIMTGVTANVIEKSDGGTTTVNTEYVYGTCQPGTTITVPRSVAEFWARRNVKYHLVEDSDVARLIEKEKGEMATNDDTRQQTEKLKLADVQKQKELAEKQLEVYEKMATAFEKMGGTPPVAQPEEEKATTSSSRK